MKKEELIPLHLALSFGMMLRGGRSVDEKHICFQRVTEVELGLGRLSPSLLSTLQATMNDMGGSALSAASVVQMFFQFLSGNGPADRFFGSGSTESRTLAQSPIIAAIISSYLSGGASNVSASGHLDFGLSGLFSSGLNSISQFIGSFDWTITPGDGSLSLRIENSTSLWSLFYHIPGLPANNFRNPNTNLGMPGSAVRQTFILNIPCNR